MRKYNDRRDELIRLGRPWGIALPPGWTGCDNQINRVRDRRKKKNPKILEGRWARAGAVS